MYSMVKALANGLLPSSVLVGIRSIKRRLLGVRDRLSRLITSERKRRQRVFQDIYRKNLWGSGDSKYYSGTGSRGTAAEIYINCMAELLQAHAAELKRPTTIVDLGCGDFEVGRALMAKVPDQIYIGCDIVPELITHNTAIYANARISFRRLDIVTDQLPAGDIYLVRQVLQHLPNAEILRFLRRVRCKYLYVTEGHPAERVGPVNPDKKAGADVRFNWCNGCGRGVELSQPPYNLNTQEIFRASSPPKEVIVTERVFLFGER